mmetsp:Transcript_6761/g.9120  ORF Transcript_6761/g.9120 Transcript_6761/m.9120 type:complete len:494 (+) Transcript_6761:108-1589(+)
MKGSLDAITKGAKKRHQAKSWHKQAVMKLCFHAWQSICFTAPGKKEKILQRRRQEKLKQMQLERERTIYLMVSVTFNTWLEYMKESKAMRAAQQAKLEQLRIASEKEKQKKRAKEVTERLTKRKPLSVGTKVKLHVQWQGKSYGFPKTPKSTSNNNVAITNKPSRPQRPYTTPAAYHDQNNNNDDGDRQLQSAPGVMRRQRPRPTSARPASAARSSSAARPASAFSPHLSSRQHSSSGRSTGPTSAEKNSLQSVVIDEESSLKGGENGNNAIRNKKEEGFHSPIRPQRPTTAPVDGMYPPIPRSSQRFGSKSSLDSFSSASRLMIETRAPESVGAPTKQFRSSSRGGFKNSPRQVKAIYKSGPVPGTPLRPPIRKSHSYQPGKRTPSKVDALVSNYLSNHSYGGAASVPAFLPAYPSKKSLFTKPSDQNGGLPQVGLAALYSSQKVQYDAAAKSLHDLKQKSIQQHRKMQMLSHLMSGNIKVYKSFCNDVSLP